jgi:hypothetical protein
MRKIIISALIGLSFLFIPTIIAKAEQEPKGITLIDIKKNDPLIFSAASLPFKLDIRRDSSDIDPLTVLGTFKPFMETTADGTPFKASRWSFDGKYISLDEYGDYYFNTNKGDFKILLVSSALPMLDKVITAFDFYCKNTRLGVRDNDKKRRDFIKLFFYSADYPQHICDGATISFNHIIANALCVPARPVYCYGKLDEKDKFWVHGVSEIEVADDEWVFFDALFSVMAKKGGKYLNLLETFNSVHDGSVEFRHAIPKDATAEGHQYKQFYLPEMVQHIMIENQITSQMMPGFDYSCLNAHFQYSRENYLSQAEFIKKVYPKATRINRWELFIIIVVGGTLLYIIIRLLVKRLI